jgi:hypothetical protein
VVPGLGGNHNAAAYFLLVLVREAMARIENVDLRRMFNGASLLLPTYREFGLLSSSNQKYLQIRSAQLYSLPP